jgi:glutamate formiminotransferase / 5-formyltetrahydrofolate cyclo-ligase
VTAVHSDATSSPLECVINLSEGRRSSTIDALVAAAGSCLLDVHTDPWHHRSVLTLAGRDVHEAARAVATAAVELLDLNDHAGAHPRLGVIDVVPFVPLRTGSAAEVPGGPAGPPAADLAPALGARDAFAAYAATELGVPCFLYGPERSLPEIRRRAFVTESPDIGPATPHPTAGAACVGARDVLVAYNLWLAVDGVDTARDIARSMRSAEVRALGLKLGESAQVSCNLIAPWHFGPAEAFDFVASRAPVARAELVGLVPASILNRIPAARWRELDLGEDRTIEARLTERDVAL